MSVSIVCCLLLYRKGAFVFRQKKGGLLRFGLLLYIVMLNTDPGCTQGRGDSHMTQVTLCNLPPRKAEVR